MSTAGFGPSLLFQPQPAASCPPSCSSSSWLCAERSELVPSPGRSRGHPAGCLPRASAGWGGPAHPLSSSAVLVLPCAGLVPSPGPYLLPPGVAVPWGLAPPPRGLWGPGPVLPRGLPTELPVPRGPARSRAGPCPTAADAAFRDLYLLWVS